MSFKLKVAKTPSNLRRTESVTDCNVEFVASHISTTIGKACRQRVMAGKIDSQDLRLSKVETSTT